MTGRPRVAVFRPADERIEVAAALLRDLGTEPVADPMLSVDPTGATPRSDADFAVLTSKTGAALAAEAGWDPGGATVCAIGDATAGALRAAGYAVDVVPDEFSSRGLVDRLRDEVDGARVEVARSDHGSALLLDGLERAGASVHETVLYRLGRPEGAGDSAELAADGRLDAALFTSSLTVEHFLEAARERGVEAAARAGLNDAFVGTIGLPTKETAEGEGIGVELVPSKAEFERLAREAVAKLD